MEHKIRLKSPVINSFSLPSYFCSPLVVTLPVSSSVATALISESQVL